MILLAPEYCCFVCEKEVDLNVEYLQMNIYSKEKALGGVGLGITAFHKECFVDIDLLPREESRRYCKFCKQKWSSAMSYYTVDELGIYCTIGIKIGVIWMQWYDICKSCFNIYIFDIKEENQ